MSIDPSSPTPIYQQIVDDIRQAVAAGVYRPGEMIPSVRAMSLKLTINPNTIARAYQVLESEGLVASVKGKGMVVTERAAKSAKTQSEETVSETFAQGIRAAMAAGLPSARILTAYRKAWQKVRAEMRQRV